MKTDKETCAVTFRALALASLGTLVGTSVPAQTPRDALLLIAGKDTITIERFARTAWDDDVLRLAVGICAEVQAASGVSARHL